MRSGVAEPAPRTTFEAFAAVLTAPWPARNAATTLAVRPASPYDSVMRRPYRIIARITGPAS